MTRETKQSLCGLLLLANVIGTANAFAGQTYGRGEAFGARQCSSYKELKLASQGASPNLQWSLQNLDTGNVVAGSSDVANRSGTKQSDKRFFGASTSKMFVGAALLDVMDGKPTRAQLAQLNAMITVSSNTAWKDLQRQIGERRRKKGLCTPSQSDMTCGKQGVADFTRRMGYNNTRGYSGNLNGVHGNELNAKDTNKFLADTYKKKYPGAETLWSLLNQLKTGKKKADKYIPKTVAVGGKTGTYDGPTEVNGQKITAHARNQAVIFKGKNGEQYGLTILNNDGKDETVALLAGGIVREYAGIATPCPGSPAQDAITLSLVPKRSATAR